MDAFPLDSLSSACAERFNLDVGDGFGDEEGNLFALATVFPSSKVGGGIEYDDDRWSYY